MILEQPKMSFVLISHRPSTEEVLALMCALEAICHQCNIHDTIYIYDALQSLCCAIIYDTITPLE